MRIKKELQAVCGGFGVKAGGYQSTWEEIQALAVVHTVGGVVRDFTAYLEEYQGDDFPQGAVSKYLQVASSRLSSDTVPATRAAKDPEVVSLARAIMRASQNEITLLDKQKIRLSEALSEGFTADEILAGFKEWFSKQDVAKDGPFLAGKFAQQAADLAYGVREARIEAEKQSAAREAAVLRLQAEAETERQAAEVKKKEESEVFDPLSE
jgi:hypothetical protein